MWACSHYLMAAPIFLVFLFIASINKAQNYVCFNNNFSTCPALSVTFATIPLGLSSPVSVLEQYPLFGITHPNSSYKKSSTAHFSGLNFICHVAAHYFCNLSISTWLLKIVPDFVLSIHSDVMACNWITFMTLAGQCIICIHYISKTHILASQSYI